jgi:undecaprenyl-diphosphatase
MNDYLLLLINGWAGRSSLVDEAMIFAARDLVFFVGIAAAVCLGLLAYKKEWRPIIYFFVTLVVSFVLLKLMGLLNVDHRPFMDHHLTQLLPHVAGKSFPSDHTTVSTAIAAGILFFTKFKRTGWLLLAAAVLVGFSRIFVGVHYPTDIVGGLFTGLVGGGIVYAIVHFSAKKHDHKRIAFDQH